MLNANKFYLYEGANGSVAGEFCTYAQARAFKLAHVAHVDFVTAHGASYGHKQGEAEYAYTGWAVVKGSKFTEHGGQLICEEHISAEQLRQQYADCYTAGYYSADGMHLANPA